MADEKKLTREERLAQALRANLARRKARARAEGETDKPEDGDEKPQP